MRGEVNQLIKGKARKNPKNERFRPPALNGAQSKTAGAFGPGRVSGRGSGLRRIVHLELDRMRGVLEGVDLFPLQLEIGGDEVLGEDIALQQKGLVSLQVL